VQNYQEDVEAITSLLNASVDYEQLQELRKVRKNIIEYRRYKNKR